MKKQNFTKAKYICIIIICLLTFTSCSSDLSLKNKKLNIKKAWYLSKGTNQTIAFIDTGIEKSLYKKYSSRIVYPYNAIYSNINVFDKNGHGTEIISAACNFNENDIFGVSPESKIMPIVAVDKAGHASPENLAKGINWAINHKATIINLSLGSSNSNEHVKQAIELALKKNIFVVAAAGDYGTKDILFPASLPNVISVESQDDKGNLLEMSNHSSKSSVLVPGYNIPVLSVDSMGNLTKKVSTGTSISTAIVSGIISLALDLNPKISQKSLIMFINESVDKHNFIDVYQLLKNIKYEKNYSFHIIIYNKSILEM